MSPAEFWLKRKGEHMKISVLACALVPTLALTTLSACETTTTVRTATLKCEAGKYQGLVGRNVAEVATPEGVITRTLRPDQPATMDYRAERLNLLVDEKGFIQQVTCG